MSAITDPAGPPAPGTPRRHLRVVPAPDPEPPFDPAYRTADDARSTGRTAALRAHPAGRDRAEQPPLPLLWLLPGGVPAAPVLGPEDFADPVPTAGSALPPPGPWAARLVTAVVEVLHGVRPVGQLTRWLAPRVHADVAARAGRRRKPPRRAPVRIRTVRCSALGPGSVEAAVVAEWGGRAHAVALRLEGLDGRWQVTALAVG